MLLISESLCCGDPSKTCCKSTSAFFSESYWKEPSLLSPGLPLSFISVYGNNATNFFPAILLIPVFYLFPSLCLFGGHLITRLTPSPSLSLFLSLPSCQLQASFPKLIPMSSISAPPICFVTADNLPVVLLSIAPV